MDAATISRWVGCIGRPYDELINRDVIPDFSLKPLFDTSDNEDLIQNPAKGVKLWFRAETKRLEQVMIILIQTVGQPIYTGELPEPFTLQMNQRSVRNSFGIPIESKPPFKLPGGMGMRGGSDIYYLNKDTHPNIMVTFSYLEDLTVNNICFSLINPGHD